MFLPWPVVALSLNSFNDTERKIKFEKTRTCSFNCIRWECVSSAIFLWLISLNEFESDLNWCSTLSSLVLPAACPSLSYPLIASLSPSLLSLSSSSTRCHGSQPSSCHWLTDSILPSRPASSSSKWLFGCLSVGDRGGWGDIGAWWIRPWLCRRR